MAVTLPREITIDRWARRDEGAYVVVAEWSGQAPIVMEAEGCETSYLSCQERVQRMQKQHHGITRFCIARLVPVEGNELLTLDLERLQSLTKKEPKE